MSRNRSFLSLISVVLVFCISHASADDRNLLPKYGSLPKTDWEKQADDKFISAMKEEYHGDLKKASADMAARGWQYLSQRNVADAMRRFNQAWLLDSENGTALWGMAAIQASAGRFDDSLKLFAEAERFSGGEINFLIDYAKAVALAGVKTKDQDLIKNAFERFDQVYKKDPQNVKNLQNWAITLFMLEKYSESWAKVKLAEASPYRNALDPRFIKALEGKMPRPKD